MYVFRDYKVLSVKKSNLATNSFVDLLNIFRLSRIFITSAIQYLIILITVNFWGLFKKKKKLGTRIISWFHSICC